MLPAAPRNRQDSLLQGPAQPEELGRGRGLPTVPRTVPGGSAPCSRSPGGDQPHHHHHSANITREPGGAESKNEAPLPTPALVLQAEELSSR